jgi:hypothetical protein
VARVSARRSAARWFVGSLLLAPFVWLLTLYLVARSEQPPGSIAASPLWGWIKLAGILCAGLLLVFAVVVGFAGQPQGGAVPTAQPQPTQAP